MNIIADACEQRGLLLRLRVSAAETGQLAQQHPEMGCRNVYGATSRVSVCLANPDVQAYLQGLVADLCAAFRPTGLVVADFAINWAEAFGSDIQAFPGFGNLERSLLSTCSCESCRQKAASAGVDLVRATDAIRTILQQSLDSGLAANASIETVVEDNPPLTDLYRWRGEELAVLLKQMGEACDCDLLVDRGAAGANDSQLAEAGLSDASAVVTQVNKADELASALCGSASHSELRVPISSAVGAGSSELVGMLRQAAELGFAGVEIDHYGACSEAAFTAIRQAARFAKRTVSL